MESLPESVQHNPGRDRSVFVDLVVKDKTSATTNSAELERTIEITSLESDLHSVLDDDLEQI
jgi:hypothetical protein